MQFGKFAQRSASALAVVGLLSFGACSMAFPGSVLTNGVSYQGTPGAKDIQASASTEMLFGMIGLNASGDDKARNEIRDSLTGQCQGGKLVNLSLASNIRNYLVYQEITTTEHATCVMPKG